MINIKLNIFKKNLSLKIHPNGPGLVEFTRLSLDDLYC